MAIIHRCVDVYGNSSITYNGSFLPYGITTPELHFSDEDPVSPPCSPRPEGVREIIPLAIFHEPIYIPMYIEYALEEDIKKRHHKFYRNKKRNLKMKHFRKNHKIKQPGGSSCNQRR